jgi:hypothetical protein
LFSSRPGRSTLAMAVSIGLIALSGGTALAGTSSAPGDPAPTDAPDNCLTRAALAADAEAAYTCLHPAGAKTTAPAAAAEPSGPIPINPTEGCDVPDVDDRCEAWSASYHDPSAGPDSAQFPSDIALSPDDKVAYLAVKSSHGTGFDSKSQLIVVAYNTATGDQLWETTPYGDFDHVTFANGIAASPDGRFVYVTGCGHTEFIDPDCHLTTLAYKAASGELAWAASYDASANWDNGRDLAVDHDSKTVYVTGISAGVDNADLDYLFLAYDAETGAQKWVSRWEGIGQGKQDSPFAMSLSPDDHFLYATGWSDGEGEYNVDYGTVAVATDGPDAGKILWSARYDGPGTHAPDQAFTLAVSPLGDKVFVSGLSDDVAEGPPFDVNYGMTTVAYDTADGTKLWEARKMWEGTTFNAGTAMATDPSGDRVYVTGQTSSPSDTHDLDFGTVAYDTGSGAEIWSDRYSTPDHGLEVPQTIAVAPSRDAVYVAGISSDARTKTAFNNQTQSGDQMTVGYVGSTGARDWLARFNSSGYDFDVAEAAVASSDSSMLITASQLKHNISNEQNFYDAGTIAYPLGSPLEVPDAPATTLTFAPSSDTSGSYSDSAHVVALLTNSAGRPARYEEVTFELSGTPGRTATALTDENGVATAPLDLTAAPGSYRLTASYGGRARVYQPSEVSTTLEVLRDKAALKLTSGWSGGRHVLRARLIDADSRVGLVGRLVKFRAGGHVFKRAVTTKGGRAVIALPRRLRSAGRLKARFGGDTFYRRASDRL